MSESTPFADAEVGVALPPLEHKVTLQQIVRYAGASRDFAPIHYDLSLGAASPWGTVIVQGVLKAGLLARMLTDHFGNRGLVRALKVFYRRPDTVGDVLTASGRIVDERREDGGDVVECELELTNSKGETTTTGTAVIALAMNEGERSARWCPLPADVAPASWHGEAPSVEEEQASLDVDRVRRAVNVIWRPWLSDVTQTWCDAFRRALGEATPARADGADNASAAALDVPPTFLAALDPFYRQFQGPEDFVVDFGPGGLRGGGNAWDEFEWYAGIRPGERIAAYGKWLEPYEKQGRAGRVFFYPREVLYQDASGRVIARSRGAVAQAK